MIGLVSIRNLFLLISEPRDLSFTFTFLFFLRSKFNWSFVYIGGASLPFISFELLDQTGKAYDFKKTVNSDGTQNSLGVQEIGLPTFSTALIIGLSGILLAASSSITTGAFFHWNEISGIFKHRSDQHRCNPYRDVQSWWEMGLFCLKKMTFIWPSCFLFSKHFCHFCHHLAPKHGCLPLDDQFWSLMVCTGYRAHQLGYPEVKCLVDSASCIATYHNVLI